jgi:hypothetical protein
MSDVTRSKAPGEETDIEPAKDGTRSDGAGAASSELGAAPSAGQADPSAREGTRSDPHVPAGDATGAGGGYGSGSADRSSGGTGEGQTVTGSDPQTEWLREAPGGPKSD